ncbi:MAG: DSD1 family PLP-dependent enzyme [Verrucomicrobiae bacterium]|nr:DSD1 family PLP-dependent enzyme [Verrucomicrobiae bacterium]
MKNPIGHNKLDLDTPCLTIDLDILEENLRKMQDFVRAAGKQLRPHAKTHKCSTLARKQIETGAIGICVAKVSEAEILATQGIKNILITGPVAGSHKIQRLLDCLKKAPSLLLVVDHPQNAAELHQAVRKENLTLNILLDLNIGLNRTGMSPGEAMAMAQQMADWPALKLQGIQAYAGHIQHLPSHAERQRISSACLEKAAEVFHRLRKMGLSCNIFSGTGTGTYDMDVLQPDLTELQTGSYALMDAEYAAIGSSTQSLRFADFRPSLTLLTSVVSANQKGFVTVDAGLKALYRDGASPTIATPSLAGAQYDWFGDEYGKVTLLPNHTPPKIGDVLELVVSHCDPTVNLFDCFYITRQNTVVDIWPIDLRGKCQ